MLGHVDLKLTQFYKHVAVKSLKAIHTTMAREDDAAALLDAKVVEEGLGLWETAV